jgi:hypothetical protein
MMALLFVWLADVAVPVVEDARAWAACAPALERAAKRFSNELGRIGDIEYKDGAAVLVLDQAGGDMCLSGSSYTLTLRRAPGRDARWNQVVRPLDEDDGTHRRHFVRRFGRVEATIDVHVYDGGDLSSFALPLLRAAAAACERAQP